MPNIASAIAAIGAHLVFIQRFGVSGAGWGLVGGGIVRAGCMWWAYERASTRMCLTPAKPERPTPPVTEQ